MGNLAPTITEETLFLEFQRFGAIQSVKIMWPRSEEEKARQRLCGFVAYVHRKDAAVAKEAMNESEFQGYVMRIGWGKVTRTHARCSRRPYTNPTYPPPTHTHTQSLNPPHDL